MVSMTYEKSERWVHSQSASSEEDDHANLNTHNIKCVKQCYQ